eukprot:CAMPEP_0176118516 /NCGR_PEP_ID=MMETSP0120_2-20121206/59563_1 /TAXON_ID=160619 /ORGANISM="Kryptoperidinium foliaceum, Strain CCMP 1326" /LENGTH=63 /DNA_ID=CAMNT_0017452859 /DNA_START=1 /DNA_END=189 /DNA_ORIENTATION=-
MSSKRLAPAASTDTDLRTIASAMRCSPHRYLEPAGNIFCFDSGSDDVTHIPWSEWNAEDAQFD